MKIIVTGGLGFIGSNFINYILKDKKFKILNLDNQSLPITKNHKQIKSKNYFFKKIDITNFKETQNAILNFKPDRIINFAAESHVDNSITGPGAFIQTNIVGTFNLLHSAYRLWMNDPNQLKEEYKDARFLHVSTDEVYGTLGEKGLFLESTPYAPNSPYSASKASSDFIVRSYFHTYGMPVITTNCSNNYGAHQHKEKLIPTIIRKAISGQEIPIYGNGKNIRDWIYVTDHCRGIKLVLEEGKLGETYNIGGRNERENLYIAYTICDLLDKLVPNKTPYRDQMAFVQDRAGHDFRYAIDADKIESELGWKADENFESGILKTIEWYLENKDQL